MKLKQLKANVTEVMLKNGVVVLFSYETPVAAMIPTATPGCPVMVRTSTKYSVSITKHIRRGVACTAQRIV